MSEADPTLEFLDRLDDPDLWVVRRNVPIFKPHTRTMRRMEGGKVVSSSYTVTAKDMPVIAAIMEKLEKDAGVPARITEGHTQPGLPEKDQPACLGFCRNPRAGVFGPKSEPCILADHYYLKASAETALKYPYRSVEFYPPTGEIRGVALLMRDPFLDLGIMHYAAEPDKGDEAETVAEVLRELLARIYSAVGLDAEPPPLEEVVAKLRENAKGDGDGKQNYDAATAWDEAKHKRAADGKFGSGGSTGQAPGKGGADGAKKDGPSDGGSGPGEMTADQESSIREAVGDAAKEPGTWAKIKAAAAEVIGPGSVLTKLANVTNMVMCEALLPTADEFAVAQLSKISGVPGAAQIMKGVSVALSHALVALKGKRKQESYSLEPVYFAMEDAPVADDPTKPDPDALTPEEEKTAERYMKHYAKKHAWVSKCAKQYGAEAAPAAAPAVPGAAPAVPGPTNGGMPKPPMKEDEAERMQRDQSAIQYNRLEAEVAALRTERDREKCERMVIQLEAEGYSLDRAVEVERLMSTPEAKRPATCDYVRQNYSRAPVGTMIRVAGGVDLPLPAAPGVVGGMTESQLEQAINYQRQAGCSWDEAEAKIMGASK